MSTRRPEAGKQLLGGLAMLAGSVALFWFSSTATLTLTRVASGDVTGVFERRLFGLVAHSRVELPGIVGVKVVRTEALATESRRGISQRLVFVTRSGDATLLQVQDMFLRDATAITDFLSRGGPESLALSSTARAKETSRFAFAQFIGALLALGGLWLLKTGLGAIVARARAG